MPTSALVCVSAEGTLIYGQEHEHARLGRHNVSHGGTPGCAARMTGLRRVRITIDSSILSH